MEDSTISPFHRYNVSKVDWRFAINVFDNNSPVSNAYFHFVFTLEDGSKKHIQVNLEKFALLLSNLEAALTILKRRDSDD